MCKLQLSSFPLCYNPEKGLGPTTTGKCKCQSESRHIGLQTGLTCMPKNRTCCRCCNSVTLKLVLVILAKPAILNWKYKHQNIKQHIEWDRISTEFRKQCVSLSSPEPLGPLSRRRPGTRTLASVFLCALYVVKRSPYCSIKLRGKLKQSWLALTCLTCHVSNIDFEFWLVHCVVCCDWTE